MIQIDNNNRLFKFLYSVLIFTILIIPLSQSYAQEDSRRNPTELSPGRIPGYASQEEVLEPSATSQEQLQNSTNLIGFSENSKFVEIRGGGSYWIGGPLITSINNDIRTYGFDSEFTYTYGNNFQKAFLYSSTQNYSGIQVEGMRMSFLYEQALNSHWSIGGGFDYREYKISKLPSNFFSRTFIVGPQRFFQELTPELIERNILFELADVYTYRGKVSANKIAFLEGNFSYHWIPESVWDPYIRPVFGLGYDTTTRKIAFKLGAGLGLRYYFSNGIYIGGEAGLDAIYLTQDKFVKSQARDRIHEATLNVFFGKKFL